jgi:hypothetical protein
VLQLWRGYSTNVKAGSDASFYVDNIWVVKSAN